MAKKYAFDYDLIVIGSGSGGGAGAVLAAREGKKVAIVESGVFGGDSLNYSNIPINALLHAANLYDEARHGARFGLRSSTLGYNYPSIRAWKDLAVKRTGAADSKKYYENQGIDVFNAKAHFISPNEISVNRRHLSADNFLIATGSQWSIPKIPGLETINYFTPKTILETLRPPKSLLIMGGGSASVEIAQLMTIFGTKVYIVEQASRLLPRYDSEVGELMGRVLREQKGVTILSDSQIVSVEKEGLCKRIVVSRAGVEKSVRVDEILIAVGRTPTTDIGLENAGVKYTVNGIKVNDYFQTNVKHIFAAGKVVGRNSQTQSATLESKLAVNNIFHRTKIKPDYIATPHVIFTNPGVATVGLTEDECVKRKLHIKKALAPLSIVARSNTSDFRDGFVKIITNKDGIILGATVVAPHAAEIIHELALAVKHELTAYQIAETPHAFLSWSEAVRIASAKLS